MKSILTQALHVFFLISPVFNNLLKKLPIYFAIIIIHYNYYTLYMNQCIIDAVTINDPSPYFTFGNILCILLFSCQNLDCIFGQKCSFLSDCAHNGQVTHINRM